MRVNALLVSLAVCPALFGAGSLAISTFSVDATPPLGAPLEMGACKPAMQIVDPLSARGIVIRNAGAAVVLVAVDWVGIGNGGYDAWRKGLEVMEIPIQLREKRQPSIHLFRRVPNVLKNVAKLVYVIRLRDR